MLPDDLRLQVLSPLVQMLVKQKDALKDVIELLESVDDREEWEQATINSLTVITSYSIHYTKLYEVAVDDALPVRG